MNTSSQCPRQMKKWPYGRLLLHIAGLLLVVAWIVVAIGAIEERPMKSWQEYPKPMRVTRTAAGYHYPYANQIQQVAQFAPGQSVTVLQKDGQWYRVHHPQAAFCWVHQGNLKTH